MKQKIKVTCEMEVTLKMIGGKCKPLILNFLIENGAKRYGEILTFLESLPKKTLTTQLREMEADGLVTRVDYGQQPPRVEYSATELGRSLYPLLEMMCEWGEKNIGDRFEVTNRQCTGED